MYAFLLGVYSYSVVSGPNIIRFSSPITNTEPNEDLGEDIGDQPSRDGLLALVRLNGSDQSEVGVATSLTPRLSSMGFVQDTPFSWPGVSASLSGNNRYRQPNSPLTGTGAFSLGAWIKLSNQSNPNSFIISQRDQHNDGQFNLLVNAQTGQLQYWDYNPGIPIVSLVAGNAPMVVGQWHHVGVSRSETGWMSMYVDGVRYLHQQIRQINLRSTNGLTLGFDQRDNMHFMNGLMSDVFISGRELTEREFQWLYKSGEPYPSE